MCAGGLLSIVSYGSQDLFLTGSPQITFFKIVYRRHTNFSIESIQLAFDDLTGFGKRSSVIIPKNGDLVHKIYLQVELPQMNINRNAPGTSLNSTLTTLKTNYQYVLTFMIVNIASYRSGYLQYQAVNTIALDMINSVTTTFNVANIGTIKSNFNIALNGLPQFTYSTISMEDVVKTFLDTNNVLIVGTTKTQVLNKMNKALELSGLLQKYYEEEIIKTQNQINDQTSTIANFAWVNRIGHVIINYIEVAIGGNVIDKHYGDWLNIFYELSGNKLAEQVYNKMIGNVPELTQTADGITTSRAYKSNYTLYIPLQFWFCRTNGLALPIIALQYHDVIINVDFKGILECAWLDELKGTQITDQQTRKATIKTLGIPNLVDYIENTGNDMYATLLIDYIYLESSERRKFAQSIHEYLIESVQINDFNDIQQLALQETLDFNHPCKTLIWVAQNTKFVINTDGYTQLFWDNYSANIGTTSAPILINPLQYSSINFDSFLRVMVLDSNYFNFIQPYQCYSNTPSLGINVYSFSLSPEENQPSGSANLSKIGKVLLNTQFNKILYERGDSYNVKVYTVNYNILRFAGGLGGIAYTV
jgi:hypothetical protein